MKKNRTWFRNPSVTVVLLIAAIGLLGFAGVGGARAALNRQSSEFIAEVSLDSIGVSLLEKADKDTAAHVVANRDYDVQKKDGTWIGTVRGTLLGNMLGEGESLVLNKKYAEALSVRNSGAIPEYVRVSIYRYWLDASGKKNTELSPKLIQLYLNGQNLDEATTLGNWIKDTAADTNTSAAGGERMVLYYNSVLAAGAATENFADQIAVDNAVATAMQQEISGNTVTTTYKYDGYRFCLEVTVDAVQDHHAADAIQSAWGVNAAGKGIQVTG